MLKQLVLVIAVVFCVSVINYAQDKTDSVLKDPHHKVDTNKVQQIDDSKETVSKEPWNKVCPVKGNPIEPNSPTVEFNGKVYQCTMCADQIADDPGECPKCGMDLKEISLEKAKENLIKHGFKVSDK